MSGTVPGVEALWTCWGPFVYNFCLVYVTAEQFIGPMRNVEACDKLMVVLLSNPAEDVQSQDSKAAHPRRFVGTFPHMLFQLKFTQGPRWPST